MQRVGVFAVDGDHAYAWLDGDRYNGRRPHAKVDWITGTAEAVADRLAAAGREDLARAVRDGARSFRNQSEADYYAGNVRLLERAYLRGTTPREGTGFGGDAVKATHRRSTRYRTAGQQLGNLGSVVAGEAGADGTQPPQTAWVDVPPR